MLLAMESIEVYEKKPQLALLLAKEAVRPLLNLKEDINTPRLTISEQALILALDIYPRPRTFVADYSEVRQVAFAADGKWLASASKDGTVRLWDLTAPSPAARPRVLQGHDEHGQPRRLRGRRQARSPPPPRTERSGCGLWS